MEECITFNIKFNKKDCRYFRVFIFSSRKAMLKAEEEIWNEKPDNYASFVGFKDKGQKWIGNLMFYRQYIGAGIVAHECLHAVAHLCDIQETTEEESCQAIEQLVTNFWKKYYKYEQTIKVGW